MKTKILFCLLCVAMMGMAQNASNYAQELVESVTRDVTLSAEQIAQLTEAATLYVDAVQTANEQFTTDDVALVQAKSAAWQEYSAQLQTILTAEQYQTLQQKKTERRNALLNQLKEGQQ